MSVLVVPRLFVLSRKGSAFSRLVFPSFFSLCQSAFVSLSDTIRLSSTSPGWVSISHLYGSHKSIWCGLWHNVGNLRIKSTIETVLHLAVILWHPGFCAINRHTWSCCPDPLAPLAPDQTTVLSVPLPNSEGPHYCYVNNSHPRVLPFWRKE